MNFYQQELSAKEIELIEKVIDFPLIISSTRICFKDIFDKVDKKKQCSCAIKEQKTRKELENPF